MKKTLIAVSVFVVLLVVGLMLMPGYLRKAILYLQPDIDDYKIFDNRIVKASSDPVQWKISGRYNAFDISEPLIDSIGKYRTTAFLVVDNDSILHEEYWDGYDEDGISNSFSMAKSIVALLVGCAIDDGSIDSVDQRVAGFLPFLDSGNGRDLTIRDLLTMSSSSSWDESYSSPGSITTKAYYGNNLSGLMGSVTIEGAPGHIFDYKSGDTQFLAMIVEKATGKSVSQYASEKLWQPLGASRDALWSVDHEGGIEKAYCCFNSNARDFALLGRLILGRGEVDGKRIVSEGYIDRMISPASWLKDKKGNEVDYYGYQWWILHHRGLVMPVARGILGQYIIVVPEYNAIVVRLGHERSEAKHNNFPTDIYCFVDAALELLDQNSQRTELAGSR